MEANKCSRCGSFYVSINGDVCPKCITKENLERSTFKSYIEDNGNISSIDAISAATGISQKNINRFLGYEGNGINIESENTNGNLGITLN